jgi:hypothetical protein
MYDPGSGSLLSNNDRDRQRFQKKRKRNLSKCIQIFKGNFNSHHKKCLKIKDTSMDKSLFRGIPDI